MSAKKNNLLSMNYGTACHRLRKKIMFMLICRLDLNVCFRCNGPIDSSEDLSIEHKEAWERARDPIVAFFDLDNIAFSRLACNFAAAYKPNRKFLSHEEKRAHYRPIDAANKRAVYTPERRRHKYITTGH